MRILKYVGINQVMSGPLVTTSIYTDVNKLVLCIVL